MFGFIGPNGVGKTTAMRDHARVLEPDAREVRWRGQQINDELRHRVGHISQERGLYPRMGVRDQLVWPAAAETA